jgi:bacterial/archaeal transporter family protein
MPSNHTTWVSLILLSSVTLGLYDVAKKHAVSKNGIMPVLALSTLTGTILVVLTQLFSGTATASFVIAKHQFLLLALKSMLVAGSWMFAYYGMRALPITLYAPIRGSQPFWTLVGALLLFGEIPSGFQWIGIAVVIIGYWLFSTMGKLEGIRFTANKGVFQVFAATILGAASGLYDKYLLQPCHLGPGLVQFWFQIDLVAIIGSVWLVQHLSGLSRTRFLWRWSIPLTGALLVLSDWFYFSALHESGTLISVLSPMRRSNAVISFLIGGLIFKDANRRKKGVAMVCIIIGVIILAIGK